MIGSFLGPVRNARHGIVERVGAKMKEMLTISQIETKFDSEWVLVQDPVTNSLLEVISGEVLFHSKDRDEVYRKAVKLRPKKFAMLRIGKLPKDTAIVL
jgi:hypothetical protein